MKTVGCSEDTVLFCRKRDGWNSNSDEVIALTQGIIEVLSCDEWLSLSEVIAAARQHNLDHSEDPQLPTLASLVGPFLSLLVDCQAVEVMNPKLRRELDQLPDDLEIPTNAYFDLYGETVGQAYARFSAWDAKIIEETTADQYEVVLRRRYEEAVQKKAVEAEHQQDLKLLVDHLRVHRWADTKLLREACDIIDEESEPKC